MKEKILIAFTIMVLGFTITLQAKNNNGDTGSSNPVRRIQMAREIKQARADNQQLMEKLNQLESRLKEYQLQDNQDELAINNLSSDLLRYQILSGYRGVEGPGVTLTLQDNHQDLEMGSENRFLYYDYETILSLINEFNSAGAEAIAINGQRYTANTEVYYNSGQLLVNGTPITLPIVIEAIGNPQTIESVLNMRFRIVWELKESKNIKLTIEVKDNIQIPALTQERTYQYAKPQEEAAKN